ncbi:MAG: hypothetical protein PHT40_04610 [Patescibacteria group bacterium]|nr:hypothetical protein [Patescibacteria group bacterium]
MKKNSRPLKFLSDEEIRQHNRLIHVCVGKKRIRCNKCQAIVTVCQKCGKKFCGCEPN